MGLNVYLEKKKWVSYDNCKTHEVEMESLYSSGTTHSLIKMASEAGLYDALWRPYRLIGGYVHSDDYKAEMEFEDSHEVTAGMVIPILEKGLASLKAQPSYFKQFNSPNGWGLYEHFVPFVEEYLNACKEHPDAIIAASR